MRGRARSAGLTPGAFISVVAVLILVGATGSVTAQVATGHALPRASLLWGFGAAIAIGECLRVQLANGDDVAPIGMASALALALLPRLGPDEGVAYGAAVVIVVVGVGTAIGLAPHLIAARRVDVDGITRRIVSISLLAIAFREVPIGSMTVVEHVDAWPGARWRAAAVMLLLGAATLVLDAFLGGVTRASREASPLRPVLRDELRSLLTLGSAIGSTAILVALAARPMGLLAVPVFLAPLLLTQFAFRRYATIRATYDQTVRALSRVTEIGGYTETGHSVRVADIAQALGRQMGLGDRELRDLEYAALLHDIGQLSLTEPIPGGATVMTDQTEQRRIARLGADVVRQAEVLDTVATIVEKQAEPYRQQHDPMIGGDGEPVPLASRIIKVANAYDDLVGDTPGATFRQRAVERIQLGVAYDYDPRVVAALRRMVQRLDEVDARLV